MGPKKQSREERLKKKREAEKKRYERIKNDRELLEKEKSKRKLKYAQQKKKGVVKPIAKLSEREKRKQRKQWKKNTTNYRARLKINALSGKEGTSESTDSLCTPHTDERTSSGRKKVRRDRAKAYRLLKETSTKLINAERKCQKYRQRYYRIKNSISNKNKEDTPRKRVKKIIGGSRITHQIKQKLLFAETLSSQLEENYKKMKTHKQKQLFDKVIRGNILKKYKMLRESKMFMKRKAYLANQIRSDLIYERKINLKGFKIEDDVKNFLEKDENSRLCPGKKETVTVNKIKKQKRLLSSSLKTLHQLFNKEHPYTISYSTFCRYKPFWIVQPNIDARNTCLCMKCENVNLLVKKLHNLKVIKEKNCYEIFSTMCCTNATEDCFFRKCKKCESRQLQYNINSDEMISYQQWNRKPEVIVINGKERSIVKYKKETLSDRIENITLKLESILIKHMNHIARIKHQFQIINKLKELSTSSFLIHIDFSENYNIKYASEPQAVHFGASRTQFTVHTGVLYQKPAEKTISSSFATLSESLRHDSCAIWAHIKEILVNVPQREKIKEIHFVSDSPSTQYRNKTNFYLLKFFLPQILPNVSSVHWHFTEAGHGKGAPDGVGAVVKRSADKYVAFGGDIPDMNTFISVVEKECNIPIKEVKTSDIEAVDKFIEGKKIIPFKGSMNVHQVFWKKDSTSLFFRKMSCNCHSNIKCDFDIGSLDYSKLCTEVPTLHFDNESHSTEQDTIEANSETIKVNSWVAVQYEDEWFPGEVVEVINEDIKVNFMVRAGKPSVNHFKWPVKKDCAKISKNNIISKMSSPYPISSRHFAFYESFKIDKILQK